MSCVYVMVGRGGPTNGYYSERLICRNPLSLPIFQRFTRPLARLLANMLLLYCQGYAQAWRSRVELVSSGRYTSRYLYAVDLFFFYFQCVVGIAPEVDAAPIGTYSKYRVLHAIIQSTEGNEVIGNLAVLLVVAINSTTKFTCSPVLHFSFFFIFFIFWVLNQIFRMYTV